MNLALYMANGLLATAWITSLEDATANHYLMAMGQVLLFMVMDIYSYKAGLRRGVIAAIEGANKALKQVCEERGIRILPAEEASTDTK